MNKLQKKGNNFTKEKYEEELMRRGRREKISGNDGFRHFVFLSGGIVLVILITFIITFIVYNNKIKDSTYSALTTEKIADLVPNTEEYLNDSNSYIEQASTDIGKSIEEAINEIEQKEETNVAKETIPEKDTKVSNKEEVIETNAQPEKVKDPEFSIPVEGEIMRGFAKDTLIYSDTLEEWITHLGIDIRADRTTVVKASEGGTIASIKNDPRYGLTIVIEHVNGFKTIYSNLLTTEFVKEGEEVEKGAAIGTVGNSASFEIVDEPHLHFEILKDGENLDPNIYLK